MNVVEFTIPVVGNEAIHIQEDNLLHFYEHLHRHNETQITWVVEGEGTLIAGNYMQPFNNGDVFLIGANQPHLFKSNRDYFEIGSGKSIHSISIFFNPKGVLDGIFNFPDMGGIKKFIDNSYCGTQCSKENQALVVKEMLNVSTSNFGYRVAAFIEMMQLFANIKDWKHLSTDNFQFTTDLEGLRMDEIYQYTIANYTRNITLKEIASVVYLTPQSFCRYFKKHTLKTYSRFLNELRINEACKVFMGTNFTNISAVAYQIGFNNVVNFNRVFKTIVGKSPGEFIRSYHNNKNDVTQDLN